MDLDRLYRAGVLSRHYNNQGQCYSTRSYSRRVKGIFKTAQNFITTLRRLRLMHTSKHLKLFMNPSAKVFLDVRACIVLLDYHLCSFAASARINQLCYRRNKGVLPKLLQRKVGIRRSPRIHTGHSTVAQIGNTFCVFDGIPLVL
jgi:hypothetical protein